jgi:pimeloyl-ACP methyl ester carboxylesterase
MPREKEGFSSFSIAGHDRGGRVAHRLTLDYPDKVKRLMVLDIAPTLFAFENMGHKSVSALGGRSESRKKRHQCDQAAGQGVGAVRR